MILSRSFDLRTAVKFRMSRVIGGRPMDEQQNRPKTTTSRGIMLIVAFFIVIYRKNYQ